MNHLPDDLGWDTDDRDARRTSGELDDPAPAPVEVLVKADE